MVIAALSRLSVVLWHWLKTAQSRRQHGLIVVACNTASTLLLDHLRVEYAIPVVGVVPAIKPRLRILPGR